MEVEKSANLKDQMGKAYERTRTPPSRPPPTDRRPQPAHSLQLPRLYLSPP